jgi:putative NADH-flavin reductase
MAAHPHQILLLGGTGPTGQHVARQALEVGHAVTVVARHPERLRQSHPNLRVVQLDLTADSEALARVLVGHDVVLSTIGRGLGLSSGRLMQRSVPIIVAAMERVGPARLIFQSAFGVGDTHSQAPLGARIFFRTLLSGVYADKAAGDAIIRRSALDWTLLYPVQLTNKAAAGRYMLSPDLPAGSGASMPRADAATAMLSCLDAPDTVRKRLVVSPGSRRV